MPRSDPEMATFHRTVQVSYDRVVDASSINFSPSKAGRPYHTYSCEKGLYATMLNVDFCHGGFILANFEVFFASSWLPRWMMKEFYGRLEKNNYAVLDFPVSVSYDSELNTARIEFSRETVSGSEIVSETLLDVSNEDALDFKFTIDYDHEKRIVAVVVNEAKTHLPVELLETPPE